MPRAKKPTEPVVETPPDEITPETIAALDALLPDPVDLPPRIPEPLMVECPQCMGLGQIPAVPAVIAEPSTVAEHALDRAPINSKIVVTDEGAMLAGPSGVIALLKSDPANRLPEGARILKLADDHYLATQLNPAVEHPPMTRTTAGEVIAAFVDHFHPRGLHG